MKVLESVQDNFAVLGINLSQSAQHHSFNLNQIMFMFVSGTAISFSYISIFRSRTFKEYTESIHMGTSLTLGALIFGISLYKTKRIAVLIGRFGSIIGNSECLKRNFFPKTENKNNRNLC